MALERFTLASLAEIDNGRIREAFEQALKRCEGDCRDRPLLGKARTVTIEAAMVPVADDDGQLLECIVQFKITDGQPVRTSKVYHMNAGRGGLFFNELSPEDAHQMTIDLGTGPIPLDSKSVVLRKDVHAG